MGTECSNEVLDLCKVVFEIESQTWTTALYRTFMTQGCGTSMSATMVLCCNTHNGSFKELLASQNQYSNPKCLIFVQN
jgi:hypothetical protein